MLFEIFLTVILNHALNSFHGPFQDLTLWINRDAESREARDMTTIGLKKLEKNSQS